MPNTLSALPSSTYNLTHDPTQSVYGNVGSDLTDNPYGEMTDAILFGAVNELLGTIDDVTGLDLLGIVSPLESLLGGSTGLLSGLVGFLTPGANTTGLNVLSPIMNLFNINTLASLPQTLIQLGLNGVLQLLGGSSNGASNSPVNIISGLISTGIQDFASLWAQLLGQQATTQAQVDALASGGFTYDPAIHGVSGWSNLVGALTLSARGAFIQALTLTVAYRASGIASDAYGASFVIDPNMRGVTGIGICADTLGAKWVGLLAHRGFDGDALWLVTAASPTLWVVQKQYDLIGVNRFNGLTTLDLRTDGINKFWVKINGKELQLGPIGVNYWTDATGIASHGASNRGVILLSNGENRNEDSYLGPAIRGKVVSHAA